MDEAQPMARSPWPRGHLNKSATGAGLGETADLRGPSPRPLAGPISDRERQRTRDERVSSLPWSAAAVMNGAPDALCGATFNLFNSLLGIRGGSERDTVGCLTTDGSLPP